RQRERGVPQAFLRNIPPPPPPRSPHPRLSSPPPSRLRPFHIRRISISCYRRSDPRSTTSSQTLLRRKQRVTPHAAYYLNTSARDTSGRPEPTPVNKHRAANTTLSPLLRLSYEQPLPRDLLPISIATYLRITPSPPHPPHPLTTMPTTTNQRPFFSNFLAAFRAQSAFQKAASPPSSAQQQPSYATAAAGGAASPPSSSSSSSSASASPYDTDTSSAPAGPRNIHSKPHHSSATAHFQPTTTTRPHHATAAAYAKSPGSPAHTSHATHSAANNNSYASPASPASPPFPIPHAKQRRGSDSSSDGGFRERVSSAAGPGAAPEKWYIGGRTATGEERFYKLGMVKRARSIDRLSLDRLSL
ncbi:uncharacterized protein K452DRAFT_102617, partial [Aplosporella prunicola CBS 121167]